MPITRAYTKAGSPLQGLANPIINGGMDIWQRGTTPSYAGGVVYTADRWQMYSNNTNRTVSRQTVSDTTNLPNIQYSARLQRTAGNTATDYAAFVTSLETVNSIPFAGKTVTFSFYARAGANYSGASSQMEARLDSGTGTDQNLLVSGFTGQTSVAAALPVLTTTWQRFSYSGTVGSTVTQLAIYMQARFSGTAGVNDWIEITGVQIDIGTYTAATAPEFRRSGGTLAGELAACYRYFQKFGGNQINESFPGFFLSFSTTQAQGPLTHKATMRTTPSVSFSTLKTSDVASYNLALTNLTIQTNSSGPDASYLEITVASGMSSGKTNYIRTDGSTSGYLYLNAEL